MGSGVNGLDYWTLGDYLSVATDSQGVGTALFQQIVSATPFQVALTRAPHPRGGSRHKNGASFTLEFNQFVTVNPDRNVTFRDYQTDFEAAVPRAKNHSMYYLGPYPPVANAENFVEAIQNPLDVVSFIGHSVLRPFGGPYNGQEQSVGLLFGTSAPFEALVRQNDPGDPYDLPISVPGFIIRRLQRPYLRTQAPFVFIAACDINPYFEDLWNITDATFNQALIVPKTTQTDYPDIAYFGWKLIAKGLTEGKDVKTAVDDANTVLLQITVPPTEHTMQFQVIGGTDGKGHYIKLH